MCNFICPSRWWYTVPEAPLIYQKVTDGITQEVAPNDNCTNIAKSTLALTMSAALDGAVFTCSPTLETGDDGKPKNADNVTIMIYGKNTSLPEPVRICIVYLIIYMM